MTRGQRDHTANRNLSNNSVVCKNACVLLGVKLGHREAELTARLGPPRPPGQRELHLPVDAQGPVHGALRRGGPRRVRPGRQSQAAVAQRGRVLRR